MYWSCKNLPLFVIIIGSCRATSGNTGRVGFCLTTFRLETLSSVVPPFSLVWDNMWAFWWPVVRNVLSQSWHANGFVPVCILVENKVTMKHLHKFNWRNVSSNLPALMLHSYKVKLVPLKTFTEGRQFSVSVAVFIASWSSTNDFCVLLGLRVCN